MYHIFIILVFFLRNCGFVENLENIVFKGRSVKNFEIFFKRFIVEDLKFYFKRFSLENLKIFFGRIYCGKFSLVNPLETELP